MFGHKWVLQIQISQNSQFWSGHHHCLSKAAYKPDSVTAVLLGEMGQTSRKLLCETCRRKLKTSVDDTKKVIVLAFDK